MCWHDARKGRSGMKHRILEDLKFLTVLIWCVIWMGLLLVLARRSTPMMLALGMVLFGWDVIIRLRRR